MPGTVIEFVVEEPSFIERIAKSWEGRRFLGVFLTILGFILVLLAQKESFKQVIPGIKGFELDGIARSILGNYRKSFIHSLGHGVGYRIHQKPWISPFKKNAVRKNDIITLEPGLYFKNKFGIRIEDMVIARKRPVYLTKINRNLVIK